MAISGGRGRRSGGLGAEWYEAAQLGAVGVARERGDALHLDGGGGEADRVELGGQPSCQCGGVDVVAADDGQVESLRGLVDLVLQDGRCLGEN